MQLLTDSLAVFRLTRLVVQDALLDTPREWVQVKLETGGHPKLAYLAGCPWCLSMWIGLGVVAARRACPRAWDPVARALAFSTVAGIVHTLTTPDE